MPSQNCDLCNIRRACIKRPKNGRKICKACFYHCFETEIHNTIIEYKLFRPGEKIGIGASGGKDSTVLAYVMALLNERYQYKLDLYLISVDEGITGYRDDSLETVKRNEQQYGIPLTIISYKDIYGWTMDDIVKETGKKNNCTYCGVFRRQALERGARQVNINHIVTGHNADDTAESILMNLLRGDIGRLPRAIEITMTEQEGSTKRSKPLMFAFEKEIVLYAHYKKLEYFSTECIYSPEAFRGTARTIIKELEQIEPIKILDIIYSGLCMKLSTKAQTSLKAIRHCERCNFISSNTLCKACLLLEDLNRGSSKINLN